MHSNRTGHILDRVAKRLEGKNGKRFDLRLADSRKRGGNDLDLLVRYDPARGAPTKTEVMAFLTHRFEGRIKIGEVADHGQAGQRDSAVYVQATVNRETMALSYLEASPQDWKKVTDTKWLHVRTAEVWNVDRGVDGAPALFKAEEDDLEDLLRQARSDRLKTAMPGVTFERMNISAGVNCYDVGDIVLFYHSSTRAKGRVLNSEHDGRGEIHYFIELEDGGETVKVPSGFMIECVRKSAVSRARDANRLQQHYRKVYPGTEFADRLTRG